MQLEWELSVSLSGILSVRWQRRNAVGGKARLITINLILFALCLPLRCLLLCATEILPQFQIYQIINKVSKQSQPQPSQRPCSLYGGTADDVVIFLITVVVVLSLSKKGSRRVYGLGLLSLLLCGQHFAVIYFHFGFVT